ncbi:MAG: UDP-N-acetylmuramate--L-alanine ligase [Bacteroidales bacterium]|nr:UDP-N-acetylmuramate--L-alanine ligase [Bacteroidales bacterium]
MNTDNIHSIYFLGIGGIGMSALARYFLWQGKSVSGYDRAETPLTRQLEAEGAKIHYREDPTLIPVNLDLVVYTPAVPANHSEFTILRGRQVPIFKRAEILGFISASIPTIAVAGTHGKTTVTSIIAHIFKTADIEFSAFMGGISTNYNTNFLGSKNPDWIIAEADEYDRSFLHLKPRIAIVTSMDPDHLDIYGSYEKLHESFRLFTENVSKDGNVIVHSSLEKLARNHSGRMDYALGAKADLSLSDVKLSQGKYYCKLNFRNRNYDFEFSVPGRYNLENAVAAAAASMAAGISWDFIQQALSTYRGVKRRFEIHVNRPDRVYVDDYAHHPNEIKACISAAREFFPGKKLTGIFQPHLFSRTKDFADGFAEALDQFDEAILMPVYPARELPIEGVGSELIFQKLKNKNKWLIKDRDLLKFVEDHDFEILITMGAGDIDQFVEPIKERLEL